MATTTASSLANCGSHNAFLTVAASDTDEPVVAAVAGKQIVVQAVVINQGDTTPSSVTFNSKPSGSGTAISPALKAAANGGFVLPFNPVGWFETDPDEGLTVTTGAGSETNIVVVYALVNR